MTLINLQISLMAVALKRSAWLCFFNQSLVNHIHTGGSTTGHDGCVYVVVKES